MNIIMIIFLFHRSIEVYQNTRLFSSKTTITKVYEKIPFVSGLNANINLRIVCGHEPFTPNFPYKNISLVILLGNLRLVYYNSFYLSVFSFSGKFTRVL